MNISAKEAEVLDQIFERKLPATFAGEALIPIIDAFCQFSQNPTSMSAGYGIEENYPCIEGNIKRRYGLGTIAVAKILSFLKESFEEMRRVNSSIYFWRDSLHDYIQQRYTQDFLQWYDSLYNELSEEKKQQLLFLLYALNCTTSSTSILRWFACFFDKEEMLSQSDMEERLVQLGPVNRLYYRTSRGHNENQFVPSIFLSNLRERFEEKIPIEEKQVEEFFDTLLLENVKLLELCSKETPPLRENRFGRITQTVSLVVESSKSCFGISPFVLDRIRELIKERKEQLTKIWKEKFSNIMNGFVKDTYPLTDLRSIFDSEGAYCWEVRYVETPDKKPVNVSVLLSPYIFRIAHYGTVLDEMRRSNSSLNLVFLIRETLPSITDAFSYVSQKNLIFLFEEATKKFYLIERSAELPEETRLAVDSFLSRFMQFLGKEIEVSETFPEYLRDYIENLKQFNRFPRLVSIRNKMLKVELMLREGIRVKLQKELGDQWKEKLGENNPTLVKRGESRIRSRADKEKARDFLDGATLGELVNIAEVFPKFFGLDADLAKGFLNIMNQHRKVLEHPFEEPEQDLDEKTFKSLTSALDYIENVICLK